MILQRFIKRIFDIVFSLFLLIILSPFLFFFGIWIKLDSKGPIFFKQDRVGKNNKMFKIYKFRSMYINADSRAASPSDSSDPRLTKVGKILRKTSIDEIPQLFNVLKGDMSLIGPRAIIVEEVNKRIEAYHNITGKDIEYVKTLYIERTKIKPGMTGLTQINGRSVAGVVKATELDYFYVSNWSLWLDIKIIFNTISIILKSRGAN